MSLTVNNTIHAKLGNLIPSWWDIHPLPFSIPQEYSDPQRYGRISTWGFGRVVESTFADLPIGALPVDLTWRHLRR